MYTSSPDTSSRSRMSVRCCEARHDTLTARRQDGPEVSSDKVFSPASMLIGVNHGRILTFTGEQMSENEMPWNCIMKKAMLCIRAPLIYSTQRNLL
jgi:hypothetical protein